MIRFGSVCSGIEAASVAWHPLGWRAAWLSEIEPFPSAVLAHHYPDVPNLGDMTALPERIASGEIEAPDVFCGGTPCQAFSVAGQRKSLDDARGNLSLTFCEIANAIDNVRRARGEHPCVVFWENVPGVLSTKDNAFGCFLGELSGEDDPLLPAGGKWSNAGCVFGPKRAVAWRVFDAQYFGVAQRRRRVFVVASARADLDPVSVLFEFEGVRRDTAPSREAGQGATHATAPCLTSSGRGVERTGDTRGQDPVVAVHAPEIARCIATREGSSQDFESTTMVAHSLRGEGFDASEDGTGRGTPLVPVTVGTLSCNTGPNGHDAGNFACNQAVDAGHVLPVAFAQNSRDEVRLMNGDGKIVGALSAEPGMKQTCYVAMPVAHPTYGIPGNWIGRAPENGGNATEPMHDVAPCLTGADRHGVAQPMPINTMIATRHNALGRGTGFGIGEPGDPAYTLIKGHSHAVAHPVKKELPLDPYLGGEVTITIDASYSKGCGGTSAAERPVVADGIAVRRLTPVECERLQGFPEINETIRVEICFDHQKSVVNVEIKCRKSQSNALSVGGFKSKQLVSIANWNSNTNQVGQEPLVALHVHQQSGERSLALHNAQKLTTFASSAEKPSSSHLFTQTESFAAPLARIQQTLALTASIGKEASHPSITLSLTEPHGNQSVGTFGGVTEACVSDVNCAANEARFTISSLGRVTVTCDSQIATLLCSVMTATSGFIQNGILPESFSVELTTQSGYTMIPWRKKPASECPDGPRYKALGNSWAVPNVRWIGLRIDTHLRAVSGAILEPSEAA